MSSYFFCYQYENDGSELLLSKDTIKTHSHYNPSLQESQISGKQTNNPIKWHNIMRIIDKNCHQINQSIKKLMKETQPTNHILINYDEEISKLSVFQKILNLLKTDNLDVLQKSDEQVEEYFQDFYQQQQELQQQYQQELVKYLNQIYSYIQNYNDIQVFCYSLLQRTQFRQSVYLGPLQQIRWECWKSLLFSNQQKLLQINNNFQNDLNYNNNADDFMKQELNKTLLNSNYKLTSEEYILCQDQLIRILISTALYLPDISYCQGLNLIAIHMLINSNNDEKNAYRALVLFLSDQKHQYQFCFTQGLPMIDFLCYVIHQRLQEIMPNIYYYLQNISDEIWIKKYIITAFVFSLDQQNIVRFWDYIMVRGALRAIPELIIAVIYQLKDKIVNNNEDDIDRILNKELNESINVEKVIYYCLNQNRFKSVQIRQLGNDYFYKVHKDKIFSKQFMNGVLNYGDTRYRQNSN